MLNQIMLVSTAQSAQWNNCALFLYRNIRKSDERCMAPFCLAFLRDSGGD